MSTAVREPAVAGYFYPGRAETLLRDVRSYSAAPSAKLRALGCVAPHAGYMYSGHVAGAVYARLELPKRFLILCPNHTGVGEPLAIMSRGAWRTPLGDARIDSSLAAQLLQRCELLTEDSLAHRSEHALEVQLPFLQGLLSDFTFVPIAVGVGSFPPLAALGEAVADVLSGQSDPVLLIASSDMNHYESDAVTRVKDKKAIDPMLALDARGLYDVVCSEHISMCGFGPAVAMLTAAKRLGATQAELVKYATSGDISGDFERVVGYAGVVVY
ncbi:MAG TPA: AmmeMemoRadiSam system protein B [Terriglobales bacterium]|nr:AmmeMemoRadiSam system protein B [Terriglobales bacterium]